MRENRTSGSEGREKGNEPFFLTPITEVSRRENRKERGASSSSQPRPVSLRVYGVNETRGCEHGNGVILERRSADIPPIMVRNAG